MKNKKNLLFLLLLSLFCFIPFNKANAEVKLRCTYTGPLYFEYGNMIDVQVVISYDPTTDSDIKVDNAYLISNLNDDFTANRNNRRILNSVFNYIYSEYGTYEKKFDFSSVGAYNTLNKYGKMSSSQKTTYFTNNGNWKCPSNAEIIAKEIDYNGGKVPANYKLIFIDNSNFDESKCDNGNLDGYKCYTHTRLTLENDQVLSNIELPYDSNDRLDTSDESSGTCCVYRTNYGNQPVYVYSFVGTNTESTFAACLGENCMTSEPNDHVNANFLDGSEWNEYKNNIGNCSNMPQKIWYKSGGERLFYYNNDTNDRNEANLTDEYCISRVEYGDGGSQVSPTSPDTSGEIDWGDKVDSNCDGIIGQDLQDFINKILRWIRILAPIFVIVVSSAEFASALLQDDKDALKKATNRLIKRLIIAVALFFVPLLLEFLLKIFNGITGSGASTCL